LDADTADWTLSSGHDGSSGRNASPNLSTARTAAMYSTDGDAYTPTTLGVAPALPPCRSEQPRVPNSESGTGELVAKYRG
jgi:hypothetical protein